GADGTTGDNTGTRRSRAEHDDTSGGLTLHGVRDGLADAGNAEEVALGLFDTLRDGEGDFAGLAVTDAHEAVTVADDDESGEAEATTTLDDLRHAVDGHNALEVLALLSTTVVAVTTTTLATAATATAVVAAAAILTLVALRLGRSLGFRGHFGLLDVTHRLSPPSRAPSAMAATRPA